MNDKIKLFFDLDGVVTDFDAAFRKISGGLSPEEYDQNYGRDKIYELYMGAGKDFWIGEDWIVGGKELINFGLKNFKFVYILSSAGTGKQWNKFKSVKEGKLEWMVRNIPQIEKKNIIIVPSNTFKANYATSTSILVDDKTKNVVAWIKKGGIGILHQSDNWESTIRELQSYTGRSIKLKEIVESI